MAFNVSAVNDYIKNNGDLITEFVLEAQTAKLITVIDGIKYKEKLNYLDTDALIQCYACGTPTTSGTTTLTDKDVTVKKLMVYEELCPSDLKPTVFANFMPKGAEKTIPFEQLYVQFKGSLISKAIEDMIWQGKSATTCAFQGFIEATFADAVVTGLTANFASSAFTATNLIDKYWEMVDLLPQEVQNRPDLTHFCSAQATRKIAQALVKANYYAWAELGTNYMNNGFMFPNTNVKVQPTNGLSNATYQDEWVLTPASNLIFATDLQNEEEKFNMWWSDDDQTMKYLSVFKGGVSWYFSEYIVTNKP
jgi:hypothetical protein